jgi:hypothetical protein
MIQATEKKPPRGGRKGGTQFPRIDLKQAHEYAKKLVSKTHTGPQPDKVILKGVFDASGPTGGVRASALKQYGLMEGKRAGYQATPLARKIVAAPFEEARPLLQQASLTPKVFKTLFDTFQNDTVPRAKVRQQAIALKVHPDTADECVRVFAASLEYAGLAEIRDDQLALAKGQPVAAEQPEGQRVPEGEAAPIEEPRDQMTFQQGAVSSPEAVAAEPRRGVTTPSVRVNIDVDPSMDPEKLEKLLKLLRQYGAI